MVVDSAVMAGKLRHQIRQKNPIDLNDCSKLREHLGNSSRSLLQRILAITPNSFKAVRLVFKKETSLVLLIAAMLYMIYNVAQVSLPGLLLSNYGFNTTAIGLSYLPISLGVILRV